MNATEKLAVLKADLQTKTTANDMYLGKLLQMAERLITAEGIELEADNIYCDMAIIHYAAYLFRKRGGTIEETAMPRYLRYELNNLLFAQKAVDNA